MTPSAIHILRGGDKIFRPAAGGSRDRVSNLQIRDADGVYQAVLGTMVYRMVTNAFVAGGGDGFTEIKNATGFRSDTGLIDSDVFREYLKGLVNVSNTTEERITILP